MEVDEETHTNYSKCKLCGGRCCKKCPGEFAPSDFGNSEKEIFINILEGVKNGVLTFNTRLIWRDVCEYNDDINYWSHEILTIIPVTKQKRHFGECIFLEKDGCKLSFK